MLLWRRRINLVFTLLFTLICLATPVAAMTSPTQDATVKQTPSATPPSESSDLSARLAAIEKTIEEKRREFGIPGVSFVIVKDDRVIYMKGLGFKDFARKLPVTPETLFAIGSSSKAFTAMTVALAADEGKLSLDDSPKKYLSYFKLRDPEADAKITIRDLLSHRSGLNRTDTAWYTGTLNREEVIRVAGLAKPTAKFREKFQYQNVMYSAAGEVVAKAMNMPWEKVVVERLFKPLGMKSSNLTVAETQQSPDFALGYEYDTVTKETRHLPMRSLVPIAPAGAINSSARDMAQWVRLMLNGGLLNGQRLVSEKNFKELISPQMKVDGKVSYGLGWLLHEWKGHQVVEHGGSIDGFNALVALMPDQKLGFVMLTNVSNSPLGLTAMETVWSNLVGPSPTADAAAATASAPAGQLEREVGTYLLKEANLPIEVTLKDGKLIASVPGQPLYTLAPVGGRRYQLTGPPISGFFMTFRPVNGDEKETEVYLEQPQGNFVLAKIKPSTDVATVPVSSASAAAYDGPLKEVLGAYEHERMSLEIVFKDGQVVMLVPGQPAYALFGKGPDKYGLTGLPDTFTMMVTRDAAGKVSGILMKQPNGEFALKRAAAFTSPLTVDELMAKVIAAAGGEANLRKHQSMMMKLEFDLEHEGLTGEGTVYAKAPNLTASHTTLMALGKKIGSVHEYFDGVKGGEESSFTVTRPKSGNELELVRLKSDFYQLLNWKTAYKSVVVKKMSKEGDEDAYVVVKTPQQGHPVTDYISAKTFLLLRQDSLWETRGYTLPVTEKFSDYQLVDGQMVPFTRVSSLPVNGDIVARIKEIKFDVEIPATEFRPSAKH